MLKRRFRTDELFAPISFGGGGGGGGSGRIRAFGAARGVLNDISKNHPSYSDPQLEELQGNLNANSAFDPNGDGYSGYPGGDWDGR